MSELAALLEHRLSWPQQPAILVSSLQLGSDPPIPQVRSYVIGECDRNQPLRAFVTFVRSMQIAWRERPDVIVTTGSLPLAIFCLAGRVLGSKIVWIDSVSQIDKISMSGRLVRPFADRFFVQWPELAQRYAGTTYVGELA